MLLVGFASAASAQSQFPPPANPVAFCGVQTAPDADSYQLVFDGAAPEAVTVSTPANAPANLLAFCNANQPGWTHGFTVAANRFTVGTHTVALRGTNPFGSTTGPAYNVVVGIAPGQFTIGAAGQLP